MSSSTDNLVRQAADGDNFAKESLLARHRNQLRRLVDVYLDRRIRGRVDPSDVIQESMAIAHRRLSGYLSGPPIAFYPWLRQIALEQIEKAHRRHRGTQKRSVTREQPWELADELIASGTSPSRCLDNEEARRRTRLAIQSLSPRDREVLTLRYMEQLSMRQIAELTGLSEPAVKMRHLRALERLRDRLETS